MVVNAETISDAQPIITHTEASSDISISEIAINMTAEDDLYVLAGGKLSEATDLDEPQVLVTQNWDIEYAGLEEQDMEEISLIVDESDKQYNLNYIDYDGHAVSLPLVYVNTTGIYGGDKASDKLVLGANLSTGTVGVNSSAIDKDDYFLLHTANPQVAANNAKTL